jgi:lipopolysaccharide biosynthesis glycosyltransferase
MILYRYSLGVWRKSDITNMYSGKTAFLIGGSPSLLSQKYKTLEDESYLTFGLNNVGKVVHLKHLILCDKPQCYHTELLFDKTVTKIAKRVHSDLMVDSNYKWTDLENTFFFDQKVGTLQESIDNKNSDLLISKNTGLSASIALMVAYGVKRLVLGGMSLDIDGHSDGSTFTEEQEKWNHALYIEQRESLARDVQTLQDNGIEVIDTSVDSKIAGICDTMPLARALRVFKNDNLSAFKPQSRPIVHCTDLYDRRSIENRLDNLDNIIKSDKTDDVPIVSALSFQDAAVTEYDKNVRFLCALASIMSIAETNKGRTVYFVLGDDINEKQRYYIKRCSEGLNLEICKLNTCDIPSQRFRGKATNFRCYAHKLMPFLNEMIWLDSDIIVCRNLHTLVNEARRKIAKSEYAIAGVRDYGVIDNLPVNSTYINAGVTYLDLNKIRNTDIHTKLEEYCKEYNSNPERRNYSDQDALGAVGCANLDPSWNIQVWTQINCNLTPKDENYELIRAPGIVHFIGNKHTITTDQTPFSIMLFKLLNRMFDHLGGSYTVYNDLLNFKFSWFWSKSMKLARNSPDIPIIEDESYEEQVLKENEYSKEMKDSTDATDSKEIEAPIDSKDSKDSEESKKEEKQ